MKESCNQFDDIFIARYIEGKLDEQEVTRFENHLATCKSCMNLVLSIKRNRILMQSEELHNVPAHLISNIFNKKGELGLGRIIFKWVKDKLEVISQSLNGIEIVADAFPVRDNDHKIEQYTILHPEFNIKFIIKSHANVAVEIHFKEKSDENLKIWCITPGESKLLLSITADKDYFSTGNLSTGNYEIKYKDKSIFLDIC